jgi:hypothetical protein
MGSLPTITVEDLYGIESRGQKHGSAEGLADEN